MWYFVALDVGLEFFYFFCLQVSSSQDLYNYEQESQPADVVYSNGYPNNGTVPATEGGFPEMPKMTLKATEDITLEALMKRLQDR